MAKAAAKTEKKPKTPAAKKTISGRSFTVTLKRSLIGCTVTQKETVRCLGLRRVNSSAVVADSPATRGQITKVQHLLNVVVTK